MGSRRWLRGQSDVMVSLSTPGPLTTLGTSRSTGALEEVRRVYEDFATALTTCPAWWWAGVLHRRQPPGAPGQGGGPLRRLHRRRAAAVPAGGLLSAAQP